MGDLFFNKVAGAVLAIFLLVMALITLSDMMFETDEPEQVGYAIDLSALAAPGAPGAPEETGPVDFGLLLAEASISAGERVARRCVACHTFNEGGSDGTGPHMWGVMGREVAAVSGFNYSSAMEAYAEGGVRWLYQNMYDYLENPRRYVPGTAMSFAGLRSQEDRINIIAYMRTLDSDPLELPDPLPEDGAVNGADENGVESAAAESDGPDTGTAAELATEATLFGEELNSDAADEDEGAPGNDGADAADTGGDDSEAEDGGEDSEG